MSNQIKIILSILLLLCLAKMPYGYYQLVRLIALVGFGVLVYQSAQQKKQVEMVIYIGLSLLFQPLIKIALGRELWNVVDVIVAIFLLGSIFVRSNKTLNKEQDSYQQMAKEKKDNANS